MNVDKRKSISEVLNQSPSLKSLMTDDFKDINRHH